MMGGKEFQPRGQFEKHKTRADWMKTHLKPSNTPGGSIYTRVMEPGPQNHNKDGVLGPNSIIVVYMDPLGLAVKQAPVQSPLRPLHLEHRSNTWRIMGLSV